MERENSDLLPHILETLSEKTEFCDTYENLCNDLKIVLSADDFQNFEVEEKIESALRVGQNLGLLTCTNDLVRMPFNQNKAIKKPTKNAAKIISIAKKSVGKALYPEKDQIVVIPTRRTRNDLPAISEHGQIRKKRNVRRRMSSRSLMSRSHRSPMSRSRSQLRRH